MANWISSKLKVAETFFEQIDQQAAESLKKNERPRSDEENFHVPVKPGSSVPLKDQLKKKATESNAIESQSKLLSDSSVSNATTLILNNDFRSYSRTNSGRSSNNGGDDILDAAKVSPNPKPTLTDSDWTELLATPNNQSVSSTNWSSGNGTHGLRKGGRSSGSNLLGLEGKKNRNTNDNNVVKAKKRLEVATGVKFSMKCSDGEDSNSSARSSSVELQSDGKVLNGQDELEHKGMGPAGVSSVVKEKNMGNQDNGGFFEGGLLPVSAQNKNHSDQKKGLGDVYGVSRSGVKGKYGSGADSRSSVSDNLRRNSSSTSTGRSDSESDSSDSESERERERRQKILAEKVAARAVNAIKERENLVARLEGEKQSLEKILEERAKQQAQEASELQTTMMETMEAVDVEKQKHNNTRMEALARLAKLETANADLARSLATAQKMLEIEINRVAELRQQFELKDVVLEGLRRRISKTQQSGTYLNQLAASKGFEFEREILEAEYSFLNDKIRSLEDKAKKLANDIEMTRKEIEDPTEVEIELKRRLGQLTDHLIQKQVQVVALSSEKATLLFRIEAVARLLDENKSMMSSSDLESGTWNMSDSKLRPMFEDKIRTGRKHLGSLVRQLDAIFLAGAVFLKRNPTGKLWCLVYLICLHLWVIYILTSHSQVSDGGRSGAIVSLENINKSAGV